MMAANSPTNEIRMGLFPLLMRSQADACDFFTELMNLVHMSPLAWNTNKEQIDTFMSQGSSRITIDLDIVIGVST
jgi:hypothetical protein